MGIFDGLGKAETFEKGNYLNPGYYVVKVERCLLKKSRESGLGLIVELDILQSTFRPQVDPKNQNRTWQNTPVGIPGTWWQSMEADGALNSVKGFVRSVLGLRLGTHPAECAELDAPIPGTSTALVENMMTLATSDLNLLGGLLVSVECYMIETQKRKQDFTVYNWSPLDFVALGIQSAAPNVRALFDRARTPASPWGAPAASSWGSPPPQGPPPGTPAGWGPPPTAPQFRTGPAAPQPAWGPPPGYGQPPAPPWSQPAGPPVWTPPPGAEVSPDRRWWRYPGQQWQQVP